MWWFSSTIWNFLKSNLFLNEMLHLELKSTIKTYSKAEKAGNFQSQLVTVDFIQGSILFIH